MADNIIKQSDLDTAAVLDRTLGPGRAATPTPSPAPSPTPEPPAPAPKPPAPAPSPKPAAPAAAAPKPAAPAPAPAPAPAATPKPAAPAEPDVDIADPEGSGFIESMAQAIRGDTPPDPAAPAPTSPDPAASNPDIASLDDVALPPHARPSTAEAFSTVKERAKATISRLTTELEVARRDLEELRSKPPEAAKPEELAELEELRRFRLAAAHRADPAFKARFEEPIKRAEDAVIELLKAEGASEGALKTVRDNGIEATDWDPVLQAMGTPSRRRLSALLSQHTAATMALEDARKQGDQFVLSFAEEQRKQAEEAANAGREKTRKGFDEAVASIAVLALKPAPAGAPESVRQSVDAVNSFIRTNVAEARALVERGTPEDIAALGAVAAASQVLRMRYSTAMSVNRQLHARLAAANRRLADLTRAGTPGTPRDPLPGSTPAEVKALPVTATAAEALEQWRLARQQAEG